MVSYSTVLRKGGIGWKWFLLDCEILIENGEEATWKTASTAAYAAKLEYRRKLEVAREKNKVFDWRCPNLRSDV